MKLHKAQIHDSNIIKPKGCSLCSLQKQLGFTPDGLFRLTNLTGAHLTNLKVLVLQDQPSKDEVMMMEPMSAGYGWARWNRFFVKAGFQESEVGFTYLRRCYSPIRDGKTTISTAQAADAAKKCRQYDILTPNFKPDVALITHAFIDSMKTPAFYRMTLSDLTKARMLAYDLNMKPIILMGPAAVKYYLPSVDPNIKAFGGSFFELQ